MKPHKHAEVIKANIHRFVYNNGKLLWADNYGPRARKGIEAGYLDSHGYIQIKLDGVQVFAHRVVWMMFKSDHPDQIDHRNRVRTDNSISNLRASNNSLNQQNASTRKDNTSGHVGVNFHQGKRKWIARIAANGKRHQLGDFDSFDEAVAAYKLAKKIYHI